MRSLGARENLKPVLSALYARRSIFFFLFRFIVSGTKRHEPSKVLRALVDG